MELVMTGDGRCSVPEAEVRRAAAAWNAVEMDARDLVRIGPFRGVPEQERTDGILRGWRRRISCELQEADHPGRQAGHEPGPWSHLAGVDPVRDHRRVTRSRKTQQQAGFVLAFLGRRTDVLGRLRDVLLRLLRDRQQLNSFFVVSAQALEHGHERLEARAGHHSSMALEADDTVAGAAVVQNAWHEGDSQKWLLQKFQDGAFQDCAQVPGFTLTRWIQARTTVPNTGSSPNSRVLLSKPTPARASSRSHWPDYTMATNRYSGVRAGTATGTGPSSPFEAAAVTP
ncbi:RICIN domain-containing protein [Streptomyces sp. NPDC127178]|uniref:RICIN domain-containing protein n=1 Tax=unclassified Streptomyces TaxID=2593676 RepID=UPI00363F9679